MADDAANLQEPSRPKLRFTAILATFFTITGVNVIQILLFAVGLVLLYIRQGQLTQPGVDAPGASGGSAASSALILVGQLISGAGVIEIVVYIACAVAFIAWVFNAFRVMSLARPSQIITSRGFVVGGFFIPVWNLVHGFNMIKELWQASNLARSEGDYYLPTPVPALLRWWWGMFLTANIMGRFIGLSKSETIDDAIGIMIACIVDSSLTIVAALLAMKVAQLTTARINDCSYKPTHPVSPEPEVPVPSDYPVPSA